MRTRLLDLASRQHTFKIDTTSAGGWHDAALEGFVLLGTNAQSAVPALMKIVDEHISSTSECSAIWALGNIGPPAKEAVPSLLRSAINADQYVRSCTMSALGKIHAEPGRVVPVLTNAIYEVSANVRMPAVTALGAFGHDASPAVPALTAFINAYVASKEDVANAIAALKQIDPAAAANAGVK